MKSDSAKNRKAYGFKSYLVTQTARTFEQERDMRETVGVKSQLKGKPRSSMKAREGKTTENVFILLPKKMY